MTNLVKHSDPSMLEHDAVASRKTHSVEPALDELPPDSSVKVLVEPAVGEFSPWFATIMGIVVLGISTAVAMFFADAISQGVAKLPESSQNVSKDLVTVPSPGETQGFIAMLVLAGLATILMLIGAYLAALETRGRLRRSITPTSIIVTAGQTPGAVQTEAIASDVEKVLTAAAGLVDKLGMLRGTTAVIASALLLYVCAVWVLIAS
jgi:hypothetical protein